MINSPFLDKQGKRIFTRSFCVYFDILGFTEKIKSIPKNGLSYFENYLETLNKILDHLNLHNDFNDDNEYKRFELKIFTDNFVIGYPWKDQFGESELGEIFDIISFIQLEFIKKGIFLKGSIAYSNLFMDKNIVLGEALIEAYDLENKHSVYPRVILSNNVSQKVTEHINYYGPPKASPQYKEYLIDKDGYYFVNYLYYLNENYSDNEGIEDADVITNILIIHKDQIINGLKENKSNNRVFEKFIWLAEYHNYYCKTFLNKNNYEFKNILIRKNYFKSIERCKI